MLMTSEERGRTEASSGSRRWRLRRGVLAVFDVPPPQSPTEMASSWDREEDRKLRCGCAQGCDDPGIPHRQVPHDWLFPQAPPSCTTKPGNDSGGAAQAGPRACARSSATSTQSDALRAGRRRRSGPVGDLTVASLGGPRAPHARPRHGCAPRRQGANAAWRRRRDQCRGRVYARIDRMVCDVLRRGASAIANVAVSCFPGCRC